MHNPKCAGCQCLDCSSYPCTHFPSNKAGECQFCEVMDKKYPQLAEGYVINTACVGHTKKGGSNGN